MVQLFVGSTAIGTGAMRSMSAGWALESPSFAASAASQSIFFRLGNRDNKSCTGIDGALISSTSVVPEPGTFAFMVIDLVGLGIADRRRRINS